MSGSILKDVRKFANDATANMPIVLTDVESQGNFHNFESVVSWLKYNKKYNNKVLVRGTINIDSILTFDKSDFPAGYGNIVFEGNGGIVNINTSGALVVDLDVVDSNTNLVHDCIIFRDITFNINNTSTLNKVSGVLFENCTFNVNVSKGFQVVSANSLSLGHNVAFRGCTFNYTYATATNAFTYLNDGCIYVDMSRGSGSAPSLVRGIEVSKCEFYSGASGANYNPQFILFKTNNVYSVNLERCFIKDNAFYTTRNNDKRAAIAFVVNDTGSASTQSFGLRNVHIENNSIYNERSITVTCGGLKDYFTLDNFHIRDNICGSISILNKRNSNNNSLVISGNNCKFIGSLDASGQYVSNYSSLTNFESGNCIIENNKVSWIYYGFLSGSVYSFSYFTNISIKGNTLISGDPDYLTYFGVSNASTTSTALYFSGTGSYDCLLIDGNFIADNDSVYGGPDISHYNRVLYSTLPVKFVNNSVILHSIDFSSVNINGRGFEVLDNLILSSNTFKLNINNPADVTRTDYLFYVQKTSSHTDSCNITDNKFDFTLANDINNFQFFNVYSLKTSYSNNICNTNDHTSGAKSFGSYLLFSKSSPILNTSIIVTGNTFNFPTGAHTVSNLFVFNSSAYGGTLNISDNIVTTGNCNLSYVFSVAAFNSLIFSKNIVNMKATANSDMDLLNTRANSNLIENNNINKSGFVGSTNLFYLNASTFDSRVRSCVFSGNIIDDSSNYSPAPGTCNLFYYYRSSIGTNSLIFNNNDIKCSGTVSYNSFVYCSGLSKINISNNNLSDINVASAVSSNMVEITSCNSVNLSGNDFVKTLSSYDAILFLIGNTSVVVDGNVFSDGAALSPLSTTNYFIRAESNVNLSITDNSITKGNSVCEYVVGLLGNTTCKFDGNNVNCGDVSGAYVKRAVHVDGYSISGSSCIIANNNIFNGASFTTGNLISNRVIYCRAIDNILVSSNNFKGSTSASYANMFVNLHDLIGSSTVSNNRFIRNNTDLNYFISINTSSKSNVSNNILDANINTLFSNSTVFLRTDNINSVINGNTFNNVSSNALYFVSLDGSTVDITGNEFKNSYALPGFVMIYADSVTTSKGNINNNSFIRGSYTISAYLYLQDQFLGNVSGNYFDETTVDGSNINIIQGANKTATSDNINETFVKLLSLTDYNISLDALPHEAATSVAKNYMDNVWDSVKLAELSNAYKNHKHQYPDSVPTDITKITNIALSPPTLEYNNKFITSKIRRSTGPAFNLPSNFLIISELVNDVDNLNVSFKTFTVTLPIDNFIKNNLKLSKFKIGFCTYASSNPYNTSLDRKLKLNLIRLNTTSVSSPLYTNGITDMYKVKTILNTEDTDASVDSTVYGDAKNLDIALNSNGEVSVNTVAIPDDFFNKNNKYYVEVSISYVRSTLYGSDFYIGISPIILEYHYGD